MAKYADHLPLYPQEAIFGRAGLAIPRSMGASSEVMERIAAPRVGGMISAQLLSSLVMPVAYLSMRRLWRG